MQPRIFLAIVALIVGLFAPMGIAWMTPGHAAPGSASSVPARPRRDFRLDDLFVNVAVVSRPVPQGTCIWHPEEWFEMRLLPRSSVPKNAATQLDQIKDRVASRNLAKGSIADTGDLLQIENRWPTCGPRLRPIRIKVSHSDCLAFEPGYRVWVELTVKGESPGDGYTQTVAQDLLILGTNPVDNTQPREGGTRCDTVTLCVNAEDAQVLSLAQKMGTLRLVGPKPMPNAHPYGLND
jgi:Flp pilus assembly protein CpaB